MSRSQIVIALVALALTIGAGFRLYDAFFVLERFGLLQAVCLLFAATLLWWLFADAHTAHIRTRVRHILSGGILFGSIAVITCLIAATPHHLDSALASGLDFFGPLGFIVGVNLGAIYSIFRLRGTSAI